MLDYVLHLKVETKKIKNEIGKHNFCLLAHKGSGFDSYVVLKILPQWSTVVSMMKNGAGVVSLKIFNRFVDPG